MAARYNRISSVNYTMYINSCYNVRMRSCFQLILDEPISPRGGTLIFSAYVGSDPASTVHPKKISEISSTPKKYVKFLQPKKISRFCIITLRKDPKIHRNNPKN